MSQASKLDSVQITALDAAPPLTPLVTGQNAPGFLQVMFDGVTPLSADTTASVYKVLRLPTNAKVKSLVLNSAIATAGSADVNVAFSDSANGDGTPVSLQGTIPQISAANNKLFGAAISLVAQVNVQLLTANTLANFPTLTGPNTPLWGLLGFTDDPGGLFDIQFNVTTAITTGGILTLKCEYVV